VDVILLDVLNAVLILLVLVVLIVHRDDEAERYEALMKELEAWRKSWRLPAPNTYPREGGHDDRD
jgi:hypothetical protein